MLFYLPEFTPSSSRRCTQRAHFGVVKSINDDNPLVKRKNLLQEAFLQMYSVNIEVTQILQTLYGAGSPSCA